MQKSLLIFIATAIFSFSILAQTSSTSYNKKLVTSTPESVGMSADRLKRLDNNIQEWIDKGWTNGGVALIIRDGKIVYNKAFGYDDLAKKVPLKTDMIFRIASQTKAITSVAVMILYEEGKFLLDEPVSKYLPEFEKPQILDKFNESDSSFTTIPSKSEITIRQLLNHTSGIGYAQIGTKEMNAIYSKAAVTAGIGIEKGRMLANDMKKLAKLPLMHNPGEKWSYGLNTDVLGYLVEVVSGMNLDQFFRKRIFEPLGMNDTYFYLPASKYSRLVTLFEEKEGKLLRATGETSENWKFLVDYPSIQGTYYSGGAGLSSTTLDYAIFLQTLLNGGEYNGKRILSRNTVRMMTMNQIDTLDLGANKFGLGFAVTTEKGSSIFPTPEGVFAWGGAFATSYWADPKEKIVGLFFRQIWGTSHWDLGNNFQVLTYQAIND